MTPPARPLGSTYRLQLHGLAFERACALVPYLADLGVETLYASPVLAASEGSTHGYDVIDPTRLDPCLGTPEEFEALLDALDRHEMRLLLDVVPNHMAAEPANPWWWDVLRVGRSSEHAATFDIDWEAGGDKVLLAILDAPLQSVLARGALGLRDGELVLDGRHRLPIDPATAGDGGSESVPALLGRQHYRLGYWRLQRSEGNYRRFFDIERLVGVRVEDPAVYERTHSFVLRLAGDARVAGLRIDHIDGLVDPAGYLRRLRSDLRAARQEDAHLLVEKILGPREGLPKDWDVQGTTGYEFADLTTRLLVDPAGAAAFERLGTRVTGQDRGVAELVAEGRAYVLDELFTGELDRLAILGRRALEERGPGHDLATANVRCALRMLIVHMDVYRTYIANTAGLPDRSRLARASIDALEALRGEDARALRALLFLYAGPGAGGTTIEFVERFEQLCGAVAAKGVEDTACYRTNGLLASAEVGGDPAQPILGIAEWHAAQNDRAGTSPGGLNGLSTHDTKRSADVRARLAALSEVPGEWERLVNRWRRRLAPLSVGGAPDPHDELFFYQSLIGVWPADGPPAIAPLKERLQTSMQKAAREAKMRTSWLDPDERYEAALAAFVDGALEDPALHADVVALLRRIGPAAATNSLAMTVLAGASPGVPDLYQGSETWQLALMDPDNRRPVDFDGLARMLRTLRPHPGEDRRSEVTTLLEHWVDGRVKLWVTAAVLRLRGRHSDLFAAGAYLPLEVRGPGAAHLVAFARRRRRQWAVAVVPRLTIGLCGTGRFALGIGPWGATRVVLPDAAPALLVDALSGGQLALRRRSISVGAALGVLPVALLTGG